MSAACLEHGLIARAMPHGDILGFAPPLVATKEDINDIANIVSKAVSQVRQELDNDGVI
jgi:L-2,4-diaminobutyrate transaminase